MSVMTTPSFSPLPPPLLGDRAPGLWQRLIQLRSRCFTSANSPQVLTLGPASTRQIYDSGKVAKNTRKIIVDIVLQLPYSPPNPAGVVLRPMLIMPLELF